MAKDTTPNIISKKHLARLERERRQRKILQISAIIIIALVLGVIIFGILDQTVLLQNKAVAKVETEKITVAEFEKQVKYYRWQLIKQYQSAAQIYQMLGADPNYGASFLNSMQQIQSQLDPANATLIGSSVLDQLITNRIIKLEAGKRGITVPDAEIEEALQSAFNFYPNGTPTPVNTSTIAPTSTMSSLQLTLVPPTATATMITEPSEEVTATPTEAPTATATVDPSLPTSTPFPTPTPYTEEGYKKAIADYVTQISEFGFKDSDLRQMILSSLLNNKLYDAINTDTPQEEEQVWARHILVKDETAAQVIIKQLKAGEDWNKLAAELSQDTSNKDKGGDLGWFGHGKMVAEFDDVAFKLEIGKISDPVKTSFGYHIIQVLGHEVRPLNASEYSAACEKKYAEWLQSQKDTLKIQKFDLWEAITPAEPILPQ